jgi:putative endonuclease
MFCTYILKSLKNDKYYIGSTDDLKRRLLEHNTGKVAFTSKHRPWKLYYFEEYSMRAEAFKREMQIKGWKSRRMIEKLKLQ